MTYIFSRNTRHLRVEFGKNAFAARDRRSSPQQAPCIICNRPIKAFDQAPLPLPLHSWPCYRRALAFLSSSPTWRLSLQSLPSSPLSSSPSPLLFTPRQPRRPPGDLPLAFPHRLLPILFSSSSSFPSASNGQEGKRSGEEGREGR